jgi:hypothetical protein
MSDPINVATQVESQTTANRNNSATTGIAARIQVTNKLPAGLTVWVNTDDSPFDREFYRSGICRWRFQREHPEERPPRAGRPQLELSPVASARSIDRACTG